MWIKRIELINWKAFARAVFNIPPPRALQCCGHRRRKWRGQNQLAGGHYALPVWR